MLSMTQRGTEWPVIAEHTDLIVAFGGIPLKNTSVSPGGATVHAVGENLRRLAERGAQFEGEVEQQSWGRTVMLAVPGAAGSMLLYQPAYDPPALMP